MDNADEAARQCAIDTAEFIGVPLTVLDVKAELERNVCRPFTEAYLRGETPNPCIICNPSTKFKNLLAEADRVGAELVATGHYARTENGRLMKGMPANDQSYMLCPLKPRAGAPHGVPGSAASRKSRCARWPRNSACRSRTKPGQHGDMLHPRQGLYRLDIAPSGAAAGGRFHLPRPRSSGGTRAYTATP